MRPGNRRRAIVLLLPPLLAAGAGPAPAAAGVAAAAATSRVLLFDPEGRAAPVLRALGIEYAVPPSFEALAVLPGDLVVIGPGGFGRGREGLGPILAARSRAGTRLLILEQAALPPTLDGALRLWPSFRGGPESRFAVLPDHPLLRGLGEAERDRLLRSAPPSLRPLLPPGGGNFRIVAAERLARGGVAQEGVRLLEIGLGPGRVIAVQAPLCSRFFEDDAARRLLANAVAYGLEEEPPARRVLLYARGTDDFPRCLQALLARIPPAGDLQSTDVLLVPADWRAPRSLAGLRLPPQADVAAFLRRGGTVVLLDPQSLVRGWLEGIVGSAIRFEAGEPALAGFAATPAAPAAPPAHAAFSGVAAEDLLLLARPGRSELRLRPGAEPGVELLALRPGIALYRVGEGLLVSLHPPETGACAGPRARTLLARILTNLGIPLDRSGAPADAATSAEVTRSAID
ncbi:MAG: hypothetical protein ACRD5D_05225 [Candidatus Polarisedimenticolia bacterium]